MTDDKISRRTFIRQAGRAALAAAGGMTLAEGRAEEHRVPFSSGTAAPHLKAPANAGDCHMHYYDDRFPAAANAALRPPNSTDDDYRKLQRRIGRSRTIIVTPSSYGTDNRPSLEAAAKLGSSARVVAVGGETGAGGQRQPPPRLGGRRIRFNLPPKGGPSLVTVGALSTHLAHRRRHSPVQHT